MRSCIFLGLSAFFLLVIGLSTLAESTVGISLIIIGFVGIKENLEKEEETKVWSDENKVQAGDFTTSTLKSSQAIFANGFLHGFSWDGAPSLAPALTMTSWRGALSFHNAVVSLVDTNIIPDVIELRECISQTHTSIVSINRSIIDG